LPNDRDGWRARREDPGFSRLRDRLFDIHLHDLKRRLYALRRVSEMLDAMGQEVSGVRGKRLCAIGETIDQAVQGVWLWYDHTRTLFLQRDEGLEVFLSRFERARSLGPDTSSAAFSEIPSTDAVPHGALVAEVIKSYLGKAHVAECTRVGPSVLSVAFRPAGQDTDTVTDEPKLGRGRRSEILEFGGEEFVRESMESIGGTAIFSEDEVTLRFPIRGDK